jgi:hypothetical protein
MRKDEGPSALDQRRTYTEWYVWAARNVSSTGEVRHACAKAALDAAKEGSDPAAAARSAAQNRSGPGWADQAEPSIRAYAEWYDWARNTLKLAGEPLHDAAAAAVAEIEGGGDATAAAAAAGLPAAGSQTGPEPSPPLSPPPPLAAYSGPVAPPAVAPPTAYPPTAYPPSAYPPSAYPPSAYPPSAYPPSAYPPSAYPPTAYPPVAYPPAVHPPAYAYPSGGRSRGGTEVPGWVAILIGIICGLTLAFWPSNFASLVLYNLTPGQQFIAVSFGVLCLLMFVFALIAIIGIVARARWARVMSIVAGATFCVSAVFPFITTVFDSLLFAVIGILLGVSVIVGAAVARRPGGTN